MKANTPELQLSSKKDGPLGQIEKEVSSCTQDTSEEENISIDLVEEMLSSIEFESNENDEAQMTKSTKSLEEKLDLDKPSFEQ